MTPHTTATAPQVGVLGDFALSLRAHQVGVSRPAQRLLAFLAVSHGPVRRTALAHRLWPESDEARAASNLRSTLWRLPRPHGRPLVDTSGDRVGLAAEVQVDLWQGERHARSLTSPSGDAPVAVPGPESHEHLRSDLLPHWCEDWLTIEQESYRQLRLHALEGLSELLCARREYAGALAAALSAVRGDPLRESGHRHVIRVHLAEGNQAEALRQFHLYRRLLASELGLPPSPVIRELVAPLLGRPLEGRRRSGRTAR